MAEESVKKYHEKREAYIGWLAKLNPELYRKRLKQAFLLAVVEQRLNDLPKDPKRREGARQTLLRRRNSIQQGVIVELAEGPDWRLLAEDGTLVSGSASAGWLPLSRSSNGFFTLQGPVLRIFERLDSEAWKSVDLAGVTKFGPEVAAVALTQKAAKAATHQDLAKQWRRSLRLALAIAASKRGKLALEVPLETIATHVRQHSRRRAWKLLVLGHEHWWARQRWLSECAQLMEVKAVLRVWRRMRQAIRFRAASVAWGRGAVGVVMKELRHKAITWMQNKAREIAKREAKSVAGRQGPPNAWRVLRARMPVSAAFDAISHEAAMAYCRSGGVEASSSARRSMSSQENLPPCEAHLWIDDYGRLLVRPRRLDTPEVPRWIYMNEVSCMVMHSERVDQFNPHGGPWLTLHGPRLGMGYDAVRVIIAVRSGRVVAPKMGACTRAYLSLLGQRIASSMQTEEQVDYTCALDRILPLPVEAAEKEAFLRILEDAVCSLDIVEEVHPDVKELTSYGFRPKVLCGNRIALWRLWSDERELPKEMSLPSPLHQVVAAQEKPLAASASPELLERLAEGIQISWRLPLLRYGPQKDEPAPHSELHVDVDLRVELLHDVPLTAAPRPAAPLSHAYFVPLFCPEEGYVYHVELSDTEGHLQAVSGRALGVRTAGAAQSTLSFEGAGIHESRRALNLADHAGHFCPHAQHQRITPGEKFFKVLDVRLDVFHSFANRSASMAALTAPDLMEAKAMMEAKTPSSRLGKPAERRDCVIRPSQCPVSQSTWQRTSPVSTSPNRSFNVSPVQVTLTAARSDLLASAPTAPSGPALWVAAALLPAGPEAAQAARAQLPPRVCAGDQGTLPLEEVLLYPRSQQEFEEMGT
eukprot:g21207.t1